MMDAPRSGSHAQTIPVRIRACRQDDLERLEREHRSEATRFERQQRGRSTFLTALTVPVGVPVGMGEILWDGCAAPEVRRRYPSCPDLNGLEVWPAERRSHGIGTALVRAAEDLARERGCDQLGLGVDDHNRRTAALYLRLGYQETGCRYLDRYHEVDENGVPHDVADPARFLAKRL
jgi:GNAT superfamily N-acetyltransferase